MQIIDVIEFSLNESSHLIKDDCTEIADSMMNTESWTYVFLGTYNLFDALDTKL